MPRLNALARVLVYLDRALTEQGFIAFTVATHSDVVHMEISDFAI
jgi:hypothetical protein